MALFAQWKFASPFLPSPTLKGKSYIKRNAPFFMFSLSGVLMSFSIKNFSGIIFSASLAMGLGLIFCSIIWAFQDGRS
jgi:hypothetical protein